MLSDVVDLAFQMVTFEQIFRAQPEVSRWEMATSLAGMVDRLAALRDA